MPVSWQVGYEYWKGADGLVVLALVVEFNFSKDIQAAMMRISAQQVL